MKYITAVWNWMKDNAVGIVIGGLILVWMLANGAIVQQKSEIDKEIIACKTLCFPQQSEYITHGTTSACWCYTNQNTMNKAE